MVFTTLMKSALVLALTVFSSIPIVSAYHEHRGFYDDPYYYGGRNYRHYSYYTHHQYHYLSYSSHYAQYNRYYYYPPPRYHRYYYRYPRCKYPGDICY